MPIIIESDNEDLTLLRSDLLSEIQQDQEHEADLQRRRAAGESGLEPALRTVQARIQLRTTQSDAVATFQAATECSPSSFSGRTATH